MAQNEMVPVLLVIRSRTMIIFTRADTEVDARLADVVHRLHFHSDVPRTLQGVFAFVV